MKRKIDTNKMAQIVIFSVHLIVALGLLNSCGPRPTTKSAGMIGAANSDETSEIDFTQTGGLTDNGRPFLTVSPETEVQQLRAAVADSPKNRDFAKNIQTAVAKVNKEGGIDFELQLKNLKDVLKFKGTLVEGKSGFSGEYVEISGKRPDLSLDVLCADKGCVHSNLTLLDHEGNRAVIIARKETRTIQLNVPFDETLDEVKNSGFEPFGESPTVEFDSTEVILGETNVVVRKLTDDHAVLFQAQLHGTEDEEEVPATVGKGTDSSVVGTVEGKTRDRVTFRVAKTSNSKKPDDAVVAFYDVISQSPTSVIADIPKQCRVHVSGPVHPLVAKILKEDCGDRRLEADMKLWKTSYHEDMELLLNLHKQSKAEKAYGQANDYKIVAANFRKKGLPQIWHFLPLIESTYNKNRIGSSNGELGLFQILPSTARSWHLTPSQSIDPNMSSLVVSDSINGFRKKFNDDVKLTLASHNSPVAESKLLGNHPYTQQFWILCDSSLNNGIRNSTCKYVRKILTGMIISVDPAAFGMTNMEALEGD